VTAPQNQPVTKTPPPAVVDRPPAPVATARPVTPREHLSRLAGRPLPRLRDIRIVTTHYGLRGARVTIRSPWLLLKETPYVLLGVWLVACAWARWVTAARFEGHLAQAEGNARGRLGDSAEKRRNAYKILSALLAAVAVWYGMWLWTEHRMVLYAVGVVLAGVFDAVGRYGTERPQVLPPPALPAVLNASVPLRQIEEAILGTFEREGFEPGSVGVAHPLTYSPTSLEYRIQLSLRDELKAEHLRAVERNIGAKDYSIRNLATDTSTIRELVIRVGDPLALPVDRPFLPTGSKSITEGIELGVSAGQVPFIVPAAGVHERAVMGTGGGKTTWYLRAEIDALSACRDCVLGGIDVTNGPEFPLWRGVIQYRGYDVDTAQQVLQTAIDEIDRRAKILTAIAEDDDPTNDTTEWHAGLGPAFVILIDEFAALAAYDGKGENKEEPNLLAMVLVIVRTGRKHWVTVRMKSQRAGKDDFGSTTISNQCGVSVAGPCSPDDSITMFGKERRDAGYTPHMLTPGNAVDILDAGKVMISSPRHRDPDLYRVWAPGSASEVKRRARQRLDDGLPSLNDVVTPPGVGDIVDAVEVPDVLVAMEDAFEEAGNPDSMPTEELLGRLRYTLTELQTALRTGDGTPMVRARWRSRATPDGRQRRGYYLADLRQAIRDCG
jgi:hypothetical protein